MSNLTEKMIQAFNTKADKIHNHDDVYPTKSWVTEELSNVSVNMDGYATEAFVTEKIAEAQLGNEDIDLSGYATKEDLANIDLSGYATETFVTEKIAEAQFEDKDIDLSGYATKEELANKANIDAIPTKVSQLVDKEDYATVEWTTEQLGQLSKLKLLPVDELPPDEEALETVIYLIKDVVDETVYNQMLYNAEVGWKQIGTTKADLSEYAKTEEVKTAISIAVPAGVVMPYGGINAPEGYLFCRGQELSKLDYPELFNAIEYNYGSNPEDENMFYLPNLSGRIPVGLEVDGATFGTIGDKGGEISHTMTREEMYMHDHMYNATHSHTFTGEAHSHSIGSSYAGSSNYFLTSPSTWESDGGDNVSGSGDKYPKQDGSQTISSTTTYHNHSCGSTTVKGTVEEESIVGFTNYTGESRPHNNLQPYVVMNYIIKVK